MRTTPQPKLADSRRLKVLFITTWYPTNKEPVKGVFVREHAKAVRCYDDVIVLHCAMDPELKVPWRVEQELDENLTEGIPTFRVRYRRSPIPKTTYFFYLWSGLHAFRHILAQGFHPDIIHAHVYEAGTLAVLISKRYHIPIVITEQWSGFPRKLLGRLDVWRAHLTFRSAHTVMPVSKALQRAIEEYGIKARFQVVPNVVDTRLFHVNCSQQTKSQLQHLLIVGLLDPLHIKGVPYLLRALAQLPRQQNAWHLDIIGDGPSRAEYERLAAELGISRKVTFHGFKAKAEVAEFMRRADLFVLPSLWDNLPCVLIEAMASGLPIVSTLTGGIPEIVNDERIGTLVPPGDITKLSAALSRMLASLDKIDRQEIAQKARQYSPESVGSSIHSIYLECIRK